MPKTFLRTFSIYPGGAPSGFQSTPKRLYTSLYLRYVSRREIQFSVNFLSSSDASGALDGLLLKVRVDVGVAVGVALDVKVGVLDGLKESEIVGVGVAVGSFHLQSSLKSLSGSGSCEGLSPKFFKVKPNDRVMIVNFMMRAG